MQALAVHRLLAPALALALAAAAQGATFTVDDPLDAPDAAPGDGLCATAVDTCTVRAAVMEANGLPGPDEIRLPAGSFPLSLAGTGEDASASGDLDVTEDLVLTGSGAAATTIDALGQEAAIEVIGAGPPFGLVDVRIRDLAITGGAGPATVRGVPVAEARVTIERVVLRDNNASLGAMQCLFTQCIARDSSIVDTVGGAGLYGGPDPDAPFSIVVERSEIARNDGGGVFMSAGLLNAAEVRSSTIRDNGGDGVFCTDGPCLVEDSWVDGNAGAGVATALERGPVIRRSLLSGNRDSGVRNADAAIVQDSLIEASAIVGNGSATGAGGVDSPNTSIAIRNSTISGNVGATVGGVDARSTLLDASPIEWSTIIGNQGAEVGGVRTGGPSAWFATNLVAGNAGPAPDCQLGSGVAGFGNLVGDATGCEEVLSIAALAGTAEEPLDPGIAPLADNGGPTPTHALLPDSPAIDVIAPAACTIGPPPGAPLARDQRGAPRPRGAGCDIGAYEVPEPAALAGGAAACAGLAALRRRRGGRGGS